MYIWVHNDSAVATEENLGLNSGYIRTQQWVHKDNSGYGRKLGTQQWVHNNSTVATVENLGHKSGYIRTQQWVRKKTWDSTVAYIGTQQWVRRRIFQTWDSLMDAPFQLRSNSGLSAR